jgi:hypothetical protein
MHIVYLIQIKRKEYPNKYIGIKSNSSIIDGKIYGYRGLYEGSSTDKEYKNIINTCGYDAILLGQFDDWLDALQYEKELHINYDVVANEEFFNKTIATENTYCNPEYATYKNVKTGKVVRLKRNHHKVISGEYVGVTKNRILGEQEKKSRGRSGNLNPFYGKTHKEDVIKKISETAKKTFTGKKKSEDQKRKMSEARKKYWDNKRKQDENQKN